MTLTPNQLDAATRVRFDAIFDRHDIGPTAVAQLAVMWAIEYPTDARRVVESLRRETAHELWPDVLAAVIPVAEDFAPAALEAFARELLHIDEPTL